MASGNQGKMSLSKRFYIFLNGRYPVSEEVNESVSVRLYKRQMNIMEDLIEKQSLMIADLTKQLKINQSANMQDKIIEMVGGLFQPSPPTAKDIPAQTISTNQMSVDLNDEQIKEVLSSYKPEMIKLALTRGDGFLKKKIKEHFPTLSEKTIERGLVIAKTL